VEKMLIKKHDLFFHTASIMFALVGGSNYSGSWRVYQSRQDAERFENFLKEIDVPVTTLYGKQYTRGNIMRELANLAEKTPKDGTAMVYFAGHGTQVRDQDHEEEDGMDEALQTDDRKLVTDDEMSFPFLEIERPIRVITIADTCHSPSLDMWRFKDSPARVISIKAALDYQSALQSGSGSYMSVFLFQILKESPNITVRELQKELDTQMRAGFAGDLQLCKVEVSHEELWDEKFL
jgi:Caspase domain